MDRAARRQELKEQAEAKRASVAAACPVPIVTRRSLGVLDPGDDGPKDDSADLDAMITVGTAATLDLESLRRSSFDGKASWHDVARVVLEDYPPTLDDTARVWVSKMGSLYHRYDDCEVMWSGKRAAHDEGMKVHRICSMLLPEARGGRGGFGRSLSACKTCI